MNILLYCPDNGVTRNFMPHLWMFVLQALTPSEHRVFLVDGNAQPMTIEELVRFAKRHDVQLVGIGAMTRMVARAYKAADALRAAGFQVVFGGPHVTVLPDEALGKNGGPRHADAVAVGEAERLWPMIVADAERGELKDVYDADEKPSLEHYPAIPWDRLDLEQFNLVPKSLRPALGMLSEKLKSIRLFPVESGRGCPYGCEFCTVTGFFGTSIRFRSDQSIVDELLRIKSRVSADGGHGAVFFVDDNFAINRQRTKGLLRAIIEAGAEITWIAQISANLLKDEELVDLIAQSGGKWIFIGMESIDDKNLADAGKSFNKPSEYRGVLERLASRNVFAITSFIFGMDGDETGVAAKTLDAIRTWPPGLPVFGQLTPFPSTPLYDRLLNDGRLLRPRHWLDFAPFIMAHRPLKISPEEVQQEVGKAWASSYSPARNAEAIAYLRDHHIGIRLVHFFARLCFRGIYFPQMSKWQWTKLLFQNRRTLAGLARDAVVALRKKPGKKALAVLPKPRQAAT